MNVEAVIKKAESDEGLTVKEIKVYQKAVKPVNTFTGNTALSLNGIWRIKDSIGRLRIFPNTCTA